MENQMVVHNKQTSLEKTKLPNSTISLIGTLQVANGFALTENENQDIAMSLIGLDFETVLYSDKIFQVSKTPQGRKDSFKMICALLTFFSQATKVKQQLTNAETIMLTDWIMRTYTHESLEDIALALKGAIFGEYKFYGSVTISSVREIIFNYFEHKAINLEKVHKNTVNDPSTMMYSPEIQQLLTKNPDGTDNYVSFKEIFAKEKREKVLKDLNDWKTKVKAEQDEFEYLQKQNGIAI